MFFVDGWGLNQNRRNDLAILGDKDIVGAAGGGCVHEFNADARFNERTVELRVRKLLLCPRAEQ